MEVEDASGSPAGQSQLVLTVSDEVQLQSISLAFSEGESQDAMNETLPYPQALVSKSATLDPSQALKVLSAAIDTTVWFYQYFGCHYRGPIECALLPANCSHGGHVFEEVPLLVPGPKGLPLDRQLHAVARLCLSSAILREDLLHLRLLPFHNMHQQRVIIAAAHTHCHLGTECVECSAVANVLVHKACKLQTCQ